MGSCIAEFVSRFVFVLEVALYAARASWLMRSLHESKLRSEIAPARPSAQAISSHMLDSTIQVCVSACCLQSCTYYRTLQLQGYFSSC